MKYIEISEFGQKRNFQSFGRELRMDLYQGTYFDQAVYIRKFLTYFFKIGRNGRENVRTNYLERFTGRVCIVF